MTSIQLPGERRVRHLTLIREPRPITPGEFNALSREERLDIIAGAQGRKKYQLLLEAADAEALVPHLPVQDLYLLIRELGLDDTGDLVPLLSSEQLTTCFDLDCWQQDLLDGEKVLPWLQALLDAGEDKVLSGAQGLDFELLVLILKKHLRVLAGPEDLEDEDARIEAQRRDGGYQFEYRDPEHAKLLMQLLDILLRGDQEFFRELVEAVRWEQEADLEENVYRQRGIRLAEQGFADPFEALAIYAWFDPGTLRAAEGAKLPPPKVTGADAPPVFFLAAARPRDLLAEVLEDGIAERTAWELTFLLNKVMMADRVDVGELRQVQAVTESVYRYLNLALEYLAGSDARQAAQLLENHYLEHLFRTGFSLTLQRQRRARALVDSPVGPFLEGPYRALVAALLKRKPAVFEGLETPERAGERPFAGVRDLELVDRWLDDLELQMRLFSGPLAALLPAADLDLTGCVPADPADLTLSDLFLTALANRLLGGEFRPVPIPRARLAQLQAAACAKGMVPATLRRETAEWLEAQLPGAAAFGDYCLDMWQGELCTLAGDELDPRFFGGLIMSLSED